ncbi:MAG TPA: ABC transporter substrate-binding protein [Deinococcales bacterium]|nr:ABC transporter substrate-binding protein [Deinococcales bacterium]
MRTKKSLVLLATAALAVAGLGTAAQAENILTVLRPSQWGAYNLNPFLGNSQRLEATVSAIYETLFFVNTVNGDVTDVLGTGYKWSNGNKTLTVTTRTGVKWNDGQAFSAKDVAFTFNYIHKYPALDLSALWSTGLQSVTAPNDTTVVFNFANKNTPILQYLANQAIVPEHIWSSITDPTTFTNQHPVATGPFMFDSYSLQAYSVVKNPNYWMKDKPYIDGIHWIVRLGADASLLAMLKGEADFTYSGYTDVKKDYAAKNPAVNLYYWPVTNGNYLYLNEAKAPFGDAKFRHAVAQAIDTSTVAARAYNGTANALNASGIIPAQQGQWLSAANKAAMWSYNPEKAKAELKAAGYKWDSAGNLLGKDGKKLPSFKILVGSGWLDFITMATVIGENFKQLGIATTIDQQSWGGYIAALQSAQYDMAISWGQGNGSSPYYFFYQDFAPEFSAKKVGDNATSNFTRYTNPVITNALKTFRETADLATQKKAVDSMVKVFLRDVPLIPLTDRNNFDDFNASRFTGWPSDKNPYNDGSPDDGIGARLVYLNVKPK